MSTTTSWIIKEKSTDRIIAETYDKKKVDALNIKRYEAVPIQEYLSGLNDRPDRKMDPIEVAGQHLIVNAQVHIPSASHGE